MVHNSEDRNSASKEFRHHYLDKAGRLTAWLSLESCWLERDSDVMEVLIVLATLAACCSASRLPEHRRGQLHSALEEIVLHEPGHIGSLASEEQTSGGSITGRPISSTIIPVFAELGSSYEPHWLQEVVLNGIREECGIALKLERREDLKDLFNTHGGVLIATGGLGMGEEQLLKELPLQHTQRMVLLDLSDESNSHDTSIYRIFGAVYRNYWRANVNQSMSYLSMEEEPGEPSHERKLKAGRSADIFWMPLGYGMNLLNNPSLMTAASLRPLLFSWSGSTGAKEDRIKMLQSLREAPDLLKRGYIEAFPSFNNGGKDTPSSYTAMLYNSSIIPCPRGVNAEQFRIWEALEVGAVPVILDEEQHRHLEQIGLRLPKVKAWEELPQFLREWGQPEMTGQLDAVSTQLHSSWKLIKSRLRKHVAKTVCALVFHDHHTS